MIKEMTYKLYPVDLEEFEEFEGELREMLDLDCREFQSIFSEEGKEYLYLGKKGDLDLFVDISRNEVEILEIYSNENEKEELISRDLKDIEKCMKKLKEKYNKIFE